MKKLVLIVSAIIGTVVSAKTDNIVDTYNFSMSGKVPYLNAGLRKYVEQSFTGKLYVEYNATTGDIVDSYATVENKKTKVVHTFEMYTFMYNLMGKANKTIERSTPTVYFATTNDVATATKVESHEEFVLLNFAGTGSLKSSKTMTVGCSSCGGGYSSTTYCNWLNSANGYFTGVMNCECPDDVEWDHTLEATTCGLKEDDVGEVIRSHNASVWGSWKISFASRAEPTTK